MSFRHAVEFSKDELKRRIHNRERLLSFGISYLDDTMMGIMPNDLVLIGAGSGIGKTQLCCNIAFANVLSGKRVHYIALEAEPDEIERRIKYQLFTKYFFQDTERPREVNINFQSWMMGDLWETCKLYEVQADDEFTRLYKTLFTFYKQGKFDITDMIHHVTSIASETDLIVLDHVHYFDYDDDRESQAIKEIARTARMLTLEQGTPIILVSHLRKRDRFSAEICPGIEEFHGSSDLYKIATKAITIAAGGKSSFGGFDTYFRVVKNRFEGSVTRYMGRMNYDPKKGAYAKNYDVGQAVQSRADGYASLGAGDAPEWARPSAEGFSGEGTAAERQPLPNLAPTRPAVGQDVQKRPYWD